MSTATVSAPPAGKAGAVPAAPAVVINGQVHVPADIDGLDAFRRWTHSAAFPERGRFSYLHGTIWADLTMEQAYTHNQVKTEIAIVVGALVKESGQGRYFGDGMQWSNAAADFATVPDGMYVSFAAFQADRVRRVPGRVAGTTEFEGTPDMVLEVVSDSSVEKDTARLPELYARAGVPEFWRVDARGELRFEVLKLAGGGYVPQAEADGWWRSEVFGRSFRLVRGTDPLGEPIFVLETRG